MSVGVADPAGNLARLATNALRVLKSAAAALGFRPVGSLIVGLAARNEQPMLAERIRRKARRLASKLVTAVSASCLQQADVGSG